MRQIYYFWLSVAVILASIGLALYFLSFQIVLKSEWITAVGIIIALFRKEILRNIFPSNIKIVGWNGNVQIPEPEKQSPSQGQTRLKIFNAGKSMAHNVEVQVTKLTDPDGRIREDFFLYLYHGHMMAEL